MSAITLEKLTKVYATGVKALDGLDLDVRDGEFVVLVGPSGCGKTTALRLVAGLEAITAGTVRFGDRVINDVSPRQRDVAMVFQNYALYPHMTVAENIEFALTNKKVPSAERERRVRSAAEVLGLTDLLNRRPAHLSGGQRQRVAMGRAIVRAPAVFLMDEPLSNLDAKLRVRMRAEVLRVHRTIGAATLYVTHDQVEAMTMGDRVAVLHDGMLQQYGAPSDLYQHPANMFVATFIGSPPMNLYEAAVEPSGSLVLGSQRLTLATEAAPPGTGLPAYQGRKVIVGIRPEDLARPARGDDSAEPARGRKGSSPAGTSLTAQVRLVEMLGSEQHVFFTIDATSRSGDPGATAGSADFLDGSTPNGVARVAASTAIRPGDRIAFRTDPARLHFFDPDTGAAIDVRRQVPLGSG
jgi:multiple sugar transport system ATP-binding protein